MVARASGAGARRSCAYGSVSPAMIPLAITVRASVLRVTPGSAATFPVDVINLGTVVDRYRCELVGLPPAWWSVSPASLELFPQRDDTGGQARGDSPPTTGRFIVTIHPPRTPEATAG